MHILFGSDHDGLHIDPQEPGAYEWWYFDALSEDSRYALVAIFFVGSPMSPYYHHTVRGKTLKPLDWCGVFVTLHERAEANAPWREISYAYNLYRTGEFDVLPTSVSIGGSKLRGSVESEGGFRWHLKMDEPGLWFRQIQADLIFQSRRNPILPTRPSPQKDDEAHTWVCVAPICDVTGEIRANGERISFRGTGYHDHNFGKLPYANTLWYWGRASLVCDDAIERVAVFYHLLTPGAATDSILLLFPADSSQTVESWYLADSNHAPENILKNPYGLRHQTGLLLADTTQTATFRIELGGKNRAFSESPFYRRVPVHLFAMRRDASRQLWSGSGEGIGEVFAPSRLIGQIVSRAVWTRTRRR